MIGEQTGFQPAAEVESGLRQAYALDAAIAADLTTDQTAGLEPIDVLPSVEEDPSEARERWLEHPLGSVAHVLAAHDVTMRRTTAPWTGKVERYRCSGMEWQGPPFEGRHPLFAGEGPTAAG